MRAIQGDGVRGRLRLHDMWPNADVDGDLSLRTHLATILTSVLPLPFVLTHSAVTPDAGIRDHPISVPVGGVAVLPIVLENHTGRAAELHLVTSLKRLHHDTTASTVPCRDVIVLGMNPAVMALPVSSTGAPVPVTHEVRVACTAAGRYALQIGYARIGEQSLAPTWFGKELHLTATDVQ
jgi:hypothetical protein